MKTNILYVGLFAALVVVSIYLGSYDTISPVVGRSEIQLAIGAGWTTGLGLAFSLIFKLALGGICTGFGLAAFSEARKAYKLWRRDAQSGRWQGGPNANWQRPQAQPQGAKLSRQDMLLLALSGRLPGLDTGGKSPRYSTANNDEDELDIQL